MIRVYTETAEEYQALRGGAGLIDHQGVALLTVAGPGAAEYLGHVSTRAVDFLLEGQISTALLLDQDGAVIAEALVHCRGEDYLVEVWPAQAQAATAHLLQVADSVSDVTVTDVSAQHRVLGIEGPESFKIAQKFLEFPVASMAYRSFVITPYGSVSLLLSRTGVTGEYGYKLLAPTEEAETLREELVSLGARECGFDALDICRMESRFANLERETGGEAVTPFQMGLQWMVDFGHEFIGAESLRSSWQTSTWQLPVCWTAEDEETEAPAAGTATVIEGQQVGEVAHAVWSPTLRRAIGVARVDREIAASGVQFRLGDASRGARTVSAPFLVATSFGVSME